MGHIPWLLGASQPAALGVLTARSLEPAAVLPLLLAESDVRWQYLEHLVGGGAGAASGAAADPTLHTELATQLASSILRAEPLLRSADLPAGSPLRLAASRRATSAGAAGGSMYCGGARVSGGGEPGGSGGRRLSRSSTAALVSGGSLEPWAGASAVDAMRLRLRAHLEHSSLYDAPAVLRSLQGTGLHEELVVLHAKVRWAGWWGGGDRPCCLLSGLWRWLQAPACPASPAHPTQQPARLPAPPPPGGRPHGRAAPAGADAARRARRRGVRSRAPAAGRLPRPAAPAAGPGGGAGAAVGRRLLPDHSPGCVGGGRAGCVGWPGGTGRGGRALPQDSDRTSTPNCVQPPPPPPPPPRVQATIWTHWR